MKGAPAIYWHREVIMTFPKTIAIIVISVLWCISIAKSDSGSQVNQFTNWPPIGSIIPSTPSEFIGEFENYGKYSKGENYDYQVFVPRGTPFSRPFHFQIIKEVPRPDSIAVNKTNKYYDYYEVLCFGHTHTDISFCDTNAISYFDMDDTSTFLITTVLSPQVITDTILHFNSTEWLTWQFNYKLSLMDSLLAIGQFISEIPQIDIYRIEKNNELIKLHTISDGYKVYMSYDYKQILIEQMFEDHAFMNGLRHEIMIYDIPTAKWTTLRSIEYSYFKPQRISRDDYLYFIRGRNHSYSLWRTTEGEPEELIYDPPPPEYVHDFSLTVRRWLLISMLEVGEEPVFKNIRRKNISLNDL
jgi:hypothetical protein